MPDAFPDQVLHAVPPPLARRARAAAQLLRDLAAQPTSITVVHHIDADGLAAGAIAQATLRHVAAPHAMLAVKALDEHHLALIHQSNPGALWFCDLGSTAYARFTHLPRIVCDHHELVRDGGEEDFPHVNPLLDGLSGSDISGATCTYLVALAVDPALHTLAPIALVGATGDLQDRPHRTTPKPEGGANPAWPGLGGPNAIIARDAARRGHVRQALDLAYFGPETRPLRKFLGLAREPPVPGATGDARAADALLQRLGIPPFDGARERTWADLTEPERVRLRSALVDHLLACGLAHEVPRLWREVTTFPREPAGPTREAQEYATLLNSTARYGRPEVGLAVLHGDRGAAYAEALDLLLDHRKHLVGALDHLARTGITPRLGIQVAHLQDKVLDTVVGIVCGMALDGLGLPQDKVLVGMAWTPDGRSKASGRCPSALAGRVDLATAMRECAAAVGGQGGGHRGAAGATVPREQEAAFLDALDAAIAAQLGVRAPGPRAPEATPPPGVRVVAPT